MNVQGASAEDASGCLVFPQQEVAALLHHFALGALYICPASILKLALDIGGSLAKLVYFAPFSPDSSVGGKLHFLKFETRYAGSLYPPLTAAGKLRTALHSSNVRSIHFSLLYLPLCRAQRLSRASSHSRDGRRSLQVRSSPSRTAGRGVGAGGRNGGAGALV